MHSGWMPLIKGWKSMKKNNRMMTEDEIFDLILESRFSVDVISEHLYGEVREQLKYVNRLTNEQILMTRIMNYGEESIEFLKTGDILHSFTVMLGIYELILMELAEFEEGVVRPLVLDSLENYTFELKNREISVHNRQILLELLLMEYEKYEYDNIFDFKDFRKILQNIVIGRDMTLFFIRTIEKKYLYKLENDEYILMLKEKISKEG